MKKYTLDTLRKLDKIILTEKDFNFLLKYSENMKKEDLQYISFKEIAIEISSKEHYGKNRMKEKIALLSKMHNLSEKDSEIVMEKMMKDKSLQSTTTYIVLKIEDNGNILFDMLNLNTETKEVENVSNGKIENGIIAYKWISDSYKTEKLIESATGLIKNAFQYYFAFNHFATFNEKYVYTEKVKYTKNKSSKKNSKSTKKVHKVSKRYYIYSGQNDTNVANGTVKRTYEMESWKVRGHYRFYKDGRVSFVREYVKGKKDVELDGNTYSI